MDNVDTSSVEAPLPARRSGRRRRRRPDRILDAALDCPRRRYRARRAASLAPPTCRPRRSTRRSARSGGIMAAPGGSTRAGRAAPDHGASAPAGASEEDGSLCRGARADWTNIGGPRPPARQGSVTRTPRGERRRRPGRDAPPPDGCARSAGRRRRQRRCLRADDDQSTVPRSLRSGTTALTRRCGRAAADWRADIVGSLS